MDRMTKPMTRQAMPRPNAGGRSLSTSAKTLLAGSWYAARAGGLLRLRRSTRGR
jgi:hypothetical protein